MKKKISYKLKNWKQYNQTLVNRGNLTLWAKKDVLETWFAMKEKKPGRPLILPFYWL